MEVAGDSLGEFVGFAEGSSNGCLVGIGVVRDDVGSRPIKVGEGYKVHINTIHMSTSYNKSKGSRYNISI